MKLYDKSTGAVIADIMANHSMSIDDCLDLMKYSVDDSGQVYDSDSGEKFNAWYDDLVMDYNC